MGECPLLGGVGKALVTWWLTGFIVSYRGTPIMPMPMWACEYQSAKWVGLKSKDEAEEVEWT